MAMTGGSGAKIQMMQHQADSVTIIASPVSGTKYEWRTGETGAGAALGTQKNVRITSIFARLTWATTQPTPLAVTVTINGISNVFSIVDPVSLKSYFACVRPSEATINQFLTDSLAPGSTAGILIPFSLEGRSVKCEIAITWATTQPTNLTLRVKWAKIP